MQHDETMNMVHESEAQRQYARVRLPATLHRIDSRGKQRRHELHDLSAGGFRLRDAAIDLAAGEHGTATIRFMVGEVELSLPIRFQVRWQDTDSGDIGCAFQQMAPRHVAVLRYLITSFLSGELVSVDDTLDIMARNNFTKARRNRAPGERTGLLQMVRPVVMSLLFFGIGLAAFGLVCARLYDLYYVSHAESATVAARTYTVTMPRDGVLQSMVGTDGAVEQGQPLALFRSSLLDLVRGNLEQDLLAPGTVEQLLNKTLKGTVTSPCNCRVQEQLVPDGQFATRGQAIFRLIDVDARPFVVARFSSARGARIAPGTPVAIRIAGEKDGMSGRVARVVAPTGSSGAGGGVLVHIIPDRPLAARLIDRPVQVSIGGISPGMLTGILMPRSALAGK